MALTRCHECQGQVSTEADRCPHCGAPTAVLLTPRAGPTRPANDSPPPRVMALVVGIVAAMAALFLLANKFVAGLSEPHTTPAQQVAEKAAAKAAEETRATSPPLPQAAQATLSIKYIVVNEWRIPAGGYGRVIVVDPSRRSEEGLLAVAEQLKQDTQHDNFAFVYIYDDMKAARLRDVAGDGRLNKLDMKRHAEHFIAVYSHNKNIGAHAIIIGLKGVPDGPTKQIKLRPDCHVPADS